MQGASYLFSVTASRMLKQLRTYESILFSFNSVASRDKSVRIVSYVFDNRSKVDRFKAEQDIYLISKLPDLFWDPNVSCLMRDGEQILG